MEGRSRMTATTTPVRSVGIVGAGLMGGGLAEVAARSGLDVTIFDADSEALSAFPAKMRASLDRDVSKGRATERERDAALTRVTLAKDGLEQVAAADAVIEAVVERIEVKRAVFAALADAAGDGTLLATNTSALSITSIAAECSRPEQVIGMHFFSPVQRMRLCEVVRGRRTSDETVAAAHDLAAALGKETITVHRDEAGFVTSRLMSVLIHEAARIVEQGLASAEDVDRACQLGFGHAMGPLATADLTGIDVSYRAGLAVYEGSRDSRYAPPQILERMMLAGELGRKTGRGFYDYPKGGA